MASRKPSKKACATTYHMPGTMPSYRFQAVYFMTTSASQFWVKVWRYQTLQSKLQNVSPILDTFVTQRHYMRYFAGSIKILNCNFLHILVQELLLCDTRIKIYKMLYLTMYNVIQNNFTQIWAIKNCNLCVLLWVNQKENVPQHLFSFTFSLKKCHNCDLCNKNI